MSQEPPYGIEFTDVADGHLSRLSARERKIVLDSLEEQLAYEPTKETRNRKHLRPNPLAPWELRLGDLRVYFDVVEKPRRVVTIQAVGIKDRGRVLIGGEEVKLK